MPVVAHIPIASSGSFLITPNVGLMIWVLVVFGISFLILRRWVFPVIAAGARSTGERDQRGDRRRRRDPQGGRGACSTDYRERLKEAREQAEEIIARARKAGEAHQKEALESARAERERLLEQTRRTSQAETSRAIDEIRREVADLTVMATERLTRKTLTDADHKRLVEDALQELDFSALSGGGR